MKIKLLFAAAIFAVCVARSIGGEATGKIMVCGIFKTTEKELIKTPESPTGITRIVDDKLIVVATTNRIPARIGVTFGIVYEISSLDVKDGDFIEITDVKTCPPITTPDGKVWKSFARVKKLRVQGGRAQAFSGSSFDFDYEMVPGLWKTEIQFNGKTLITQEFTVYKE